MSAQPAFFESLAIRRIYDEDAEIWWFSVVDIMQVLTQQPDYQTARKHWNKLKERLGKEGSQSVTDCHRLKLPAADGKNYLTDVATDEAAGMAENSEAASRGGAIARQARRTLEAMIGKSVVTGENFLPPAGARPHKVTKKS